MVLLIDNFDSFTFNLVHYFEEAGEEVVVRRNNQITAEEALALDPSLICLSPGPGRPEAAGAMPAIIDAAIGKIPIFGVCLGHQALAQHFGAEIVHSPSLMHGKTSQITHPCRGLFDGIASPQQVCRYHSLTIAPESLPPSLEVRARTKEGIIMAIETPGHAACGVQFHPEAILTNDGKQVIRNAILWAKDAALLS